MKSEQFEHNLRKHKRQEECKRWYSLAYECRETQEQRTRYVKYCKDPRRTKEFKQLLEMLESGEASKIITTPLT